MLVEQVRQEGDGLDGLSQSHLISEDNTIAPEEKEEDKMMAELFLLLFLSEMIKTTQSHIL